MAISVESRAYFKALGSRIARFRRAQDITQSELADILDVSQQTVFAYEAGERRVSLSLLPLLAKTLGVSIEELVGTATSVAAKKQQLSPVLLRQAELLQQLPREDQRILAWLIKTLLNGHNSR
jgi:transcriptional regulator with XRE-family HTH domain